MPIRKPSDKGAKRSYSEMEIGQIVGKKLAMEKVLEWNPTLPKESPKRELWAAFDFLAASHSILYDTEDIPQDVEKAYSTISNWLFKWRPSDMSPEEKGPWLVNAEFERMELMKRVCEVKSELEPLEAARKNKFTWWFMMLFLEAKRRELAHELDGIGEKIYDIDRGIYAHNKERKGE